ncbi:hypothetical protein SLS58_010649 [Diplodia intermedia]|uniref:Uncharacterized protein n=1 Tax=Diplodia intermedia TaxID=856260 RepID=A0ABR3T4K9_9PEZI
MQTKALIKLFLFLSATSQASPLHGARGRKDLVAASADLSPVSGLPMTNNKPDEKVAARGTTEDVSVDLSPISRLPVAGPPAGVARRQDYGAAPPSTSTTTGDVQGADALPSYGDVQGQDGADDGASDGETGEADSDYGSDDDDSDSDSDAGSDWDVESVWDAESEAGDDEDDEQDEGEEEEGGAEGADDQEKPDTVPVASVPSYTPGSIFSHPHLVGGGHEKSAEGEAASAPSYGAEPGKTESAEGESAPSYA